MDTPEQNKRIVRRFFDDVCNKGKKEIILEIFAETVRFNGKREPSYKSVKKYLKKIKKSFTDPYVQVKEQIAERDMVSTSRVWTGIQKKDYNHYPSTGKLMTWTEISVVRFLTGKIVEDSVMSSPLVPVKNEDISAVAGCATNK